MTILLVDTTRELGGAQRSLLELATALRARGMAVHAAVPAGPLADALRAAGVPSRLIAPVRLYRAVHPRALLEAVRFLFAKFRLFRAIRTLHPDLVHANGLTSALLTVGVSPPCPVVWHVRDLSMHVAAVHHVARRVASIVGVSESVSENLGEMVPSFQLQKVRLVRNGIDTSHYLPADRTAARHRFHLPADAPLIGMVAHLVPWKRHAFFLDVAAAVHQARSDARFVIAGRDLFHDHPKLRAKLEARIAAAGLSGAITWVQNLDDVAPLLPALDVLVHPAAAEPFGRVLCEAMSAGIPVVACNSAGPATIVADGLTGYLVSPGDAESFVRQTLLLLNNPGTAHSMGAAARQHVLANFTIERAAAELHAVYTEVLDRAARERRNHEDSQKSHRDPDDD